MTGGRGGARQGAALLAVLGTTLLWSLAYPLARRLLEQVPPLRLVAAQVAVSGVIAGIGLLVARRRCSRGDLFRTAAAGAAGLLLTQYFFFAGLARTAPSHAAVILALTPVFVAILARIFLGEAVPRRRAAGIGIALAGAVALAFESRPGERIAPTIEGDLYILAGAASYAAFVLLAKRSSERMGALRAYAHSAVAALVLAAPLLAAELPRLSLERLGTEEKLLLAFVVLGYSLTANALFYWGSARLDAAQVAAFTYLEPVLVAAFSAVILGERVTPLLVAAGLVVLAGLALAESRPGAGQPTRKGNSPRTASGPERPTSSL